MAARGAVAFAALALGAPALLVPLGAVAVAALAAGGQQSSQAGVVCDYSGGSLEARTSTGETVTLVPAQMTNAAQVVSAGSSVGRRAQVVAVTTALAESTLRNLANDGSFVYPSGGSAVMTASQWEAARTVVVESMSLPHEGVGHDWDSAGIFQQRPSAGWGSVAQIMSPTQSAATFYRRLSSVAGWEQLGVGEAAQAVQASAFPSAYERWVPVAEAVVSAVSGVSCHAPTSGEAGPVIGVTGRRQKVVSYALSQVGKAYVWAADGPDAFDCSGLTLRAYEQAGIALAHQSEAQRDAGVEVSADAARPGDLLWWPGHIAIYLGGGRMVGAQNPSDGVVEIDVYGSPTYIHFPALDE